MNASTLALLGLGLFVVSRKNSPSPATPSSQNVTPAMIYSDPFVNVSSSTARILATSTTTGEALTRLARNVDVPFIAPDLSENSQPIIIASPAFTTAGMEAYATYAQNKALTAATNALLAQNPNIRQSQLVTWSEQSSYGAHDAAKQTYEDAWNSNNEAWLQSIIGSIK